MKKKKKKVGKIIIPRGAIVYPHEMEVAEILSSDGDDVIFLPVRIIPTPDILYLGKEWEIKTPVGRSSRTIENNLRNALKQSKNLIINLRRITISEEKCVREIRRQIGLLNGIGGVKIVTKSSKIIDLV